MSKGKLYLIPTVIAEGQADTIPEQVRSVIQRTDHFLVEEIRTARRYISSLKLGIVIEQLHFDVLKKSTPPGLMEKYFTPVHQGKDIGILSESGCPGIADPGSEAVSYAHRHGIQVVPLVGPSSLLLALMASGFNGQQFAFHGYLPIDKKQLETKLKQLEAASAANNQSQLFIETPYRNNRMLESLKKHCHPLTRLCVVKDATGEKEWIKTATIQQWQSTTVDLHKIPAIFVLYAGS